MAMVGGCPAFSEGCPFSKSDADLLPTLFKTLPVASSTQRCPAFKDGCPFKETDSVETLYSKLSDMPPTHQPRAGSENPASKAVDETLRMLHTKSVEMKAKFSAPCPLFEMSCPFKTVTSSGSLLVAELDGVVDRWGLIEAGSTPRTQSEETALEKAVEECSAESLSKSLKSGTKTCHRAAENVHFVRDLLKGHLKHSSYVELLRAMYHLYFAMEECLRDLPSHLKHCDFSLLERAAALESDLRYHLGTPAGESVDFGKPSPAAQQYVDRLQQMSREDPLMLLAHAYTRYLGDLSGGQILARSAAKAFDLPPGVGTEFYSFKSIGTTPADCKAFKKSYRESLDALRISAKRADDLVKEANKAFLLNILIFEERDVAAGHLERVRTLDDISQLVQNNTSPLGFQQAYRAKVPEVTSQCPFIPGPAGQRRAGEPSFRGDSDSCPWPFIWTHSPKSAIVAHPIKNAFSLVAIFGAFRVAWEYPRRSTLVLFSAILTSPLIKPKGHK